MESLIDVKDIENILETNNKFMTLNEIYSAFYEKYGMLDCKDPNAVIRGTIYKYCIDRDRLLKNVDPIFFSINKKQTRDNKYGLLKWLDSPSLNVDIDMHILDLILKSDDNSEPYEALESISSPFLLEQTKYNTLKRRHLIAVNAIYKANFMCELGLNHPSFVRKCNNKNYTEVHHIIPLCNQKDFQYTLDTSANVISLCSNCHNQLHYGKDKIELLRKIYDLRKEDLAKSHLDISFEKLCSYYNEKEELR